MEKVKRMDEFCFSNNQLEEIKITLKTGLEEEDWDLVLEALDLLQNPAPDFDNFFDDD